VIGVGKNMMDEWFSEIFVTKFPSWLCTIMYFICWK